MCGSASLKLPKDIQLVKYKSKYNGSTKTPKKSMF